jgi:hypothetical protein
LTLRSEAYPNARNVCGSPRLGSRLSNGRDILPDVDGRSLIARRYRDITSAIPQKVEAMEEAKTKYQILGGQEARADGPSVGGNKNLRTTAWIKVLRPNLGM